MTVLDPWQKSSILSVTWDLTLTITLITKAQTVYVKNEYMRDILVNQLVRWINNVLEFTDHETIEAILFSADFEKTFDSMTMPFFFLRSSALDLMMISCSRYELLFMGP